MRGYRLLFGGAVLAMFLANSLGYLAPLVGSAALDLALAGAQTMQIPAISQQLVNWLGGTEYLRDHLWIAAAMMAKAVPPSR